MRMFTICDVIPQNMKHSMHEILSPGVLYQEI